MGAYELRVLNVEEFFAGFKTAAFITNLADNGQCKEYGMIRGAELYANFIRYRVTLSGGTFDRFFEFEPGMDIAFFRDPIDGKKIFVYKDKKLTHIIEAGK